jgi:hypothetical protein
MLPELVAVDRRATVQSIPALGDRGLPQWPGLFVAGSPQTTHKPVLNAEQQF